MGKAYIQLFGQEPSEIKIHWLGYGFSIDFKIHTLGYGFLFGNHKHLTEVSRLLVRGLFSWDLKNLLLVWVSYEFLVVLTVFHQCLFKIITNLKFYKRCFIKDNLQNFFYIIGWYSYLVRQRNP